MTQPRPAGAPSLTREQRQILDYIGEMSLELSAMAGRVGFDDLAHDLTQSGEKARDRVYLARALDGLN